MIGAADFLKDHGDDDRGGLDAHIDKSEGAFEERVVRALVRTFGLDPKAWDTGPGSRFRLASFDAVHSDFPVRLAAARLPATQLSAEKRYTGNLGFHELTPSVLFVPAEFCKTSVFKTWAGLKDEPTLDARPLGLAFACIGRLFVVHDWPGVAGRVPARLEIVLPELSLSVHPFDTLLAVIREDGWTSAR